MARPGKKDGLRYIEPHRGSDGKLRYYFRRGKGTRTAMPPVDGDPKLDPAFMMAYGILFSEATGKNLPTHTQPKTRARPVVMPPTKVERQKQMTETALQNGIANAARRARARKRSFDLTLDWVLLVAERQGFCCALTGIPFFSAHTATGKTNPFAPSLDRIDPRGGYTRDNVRIVIFAINLMLYDWGHEVFETVMNAYRHALCFDRLATRNGDSNG